MTPISPPIAIAGAKTVKLLTHDRLERLAEPAIDDVGFRQAANEHVDVIDAGVCGLHVLLQHRVTRQGAE
jgi:hypothetical protein